VKKIGVSTQFGHTYLSFMLLIPSGLFLAIQPLGIRFSPFEQLLHCLQAN
jgi:hypothetical protein